MKLALAAIAAALMCSIPVAASAESYSERLGDAMKDARWTGPLLASNAETLRAWVSNLTNVPIFPPEVFFLSSLPSKIDPGEVTVVACLALGLSFLATLYPAWRAAQYDPVEALRYE